MMLSQYAAAPIEESKLLILSRLASQIGDEAEVIRLLHKCTDMRPALGQEDRANLFMAYRDVWHHRKRALAKLKEEHESQQGPMKQLVGQEYAAQKQQLMQFGYEIIDRMEKLLVPNCPDAEGKVRYLLKTTQIYKNMIQVTGINSELINTTLSIYAKATQIAEEGLHPCNPALLNLALSYSVFQYELVGDAKAATSIAKRAFERAMGELETLANTQYQDSTLVMQLIRDNLTMWACEKKQG